MASDDYEGSIEYDEQFEEEQEDEPTAHVFAAHAAADSSKVAATSVANQPSAAASQLNTGPAAVNALTDAELDEYLEDDEPVLAEKARSGTPAPIAAEPVVPAPHASASSSSSAMPSSAVAVTDLAADQQPSTEQFSSTELLSAPANRSNNRASRQSSRQRTSGSIRNSRQASRRASSDASSPTCVAALPNNSKGQMDSALSHQHSLNPDQQHDSSGALVLEYDGIADDSVNASNPASTSKQSSTRHAAATKALCQPAGQASALAGILAGSAVDPAIQAWLPSAAEVQPVQQQLAGLSVSSSKQPAVMAAAAAASAFSANAVAAAASAAAAIAAAEAAAAQASAAPMHGSHCSSSSSSQRRQRPESASAAVGYGKLQREHSQPCAQQDPVGSNWLIEQQQDNRCVYQQRVEVVPVARWSVWDVCDWIDGMGLPQYRKKFMHHCIDGHLLLKLTDATMKSELAIGPLGHRALLMEAIELVRTADVAAAASAAATGMPAEHIAPSGCSSGAAAAVLVAGCIAARAAERQAAGKHGSRGVSSAGLARAGSGALCESPAWEASSREGSLAGSPSAARGRPCSAPTKRISSRSQSPQPVGRGALGPAAGRISVYEQRAKLLFELSRAQARAAAQSTNAAQVGDTARLAAEEVARLQGQLADLDRKNKMQVQHSAGSLDSRGQIPWQHTGSGTRAGDPHPERFARPWDPPEADMTFSPKISRNSQRIMAEARGESGSSGFLDRLNNDLKRRQVKMKELERRYHSASGAIDAGNAAAAAKAFTADLQLVAGYFSQRGWANLDVPESSNGGSIDVTVLQELDEQLNEILEAHAKDLSLSDAQRRCILAARGAKKFASLASAVRTQQFMDRYAADLSTRDSRLRDLQEKWFKQQLQGVPAAAGPTGRAPVAPLTADQRDMHQAALWFQQLGWEVDSPDDDCSDLLEALIKRARAYKTEVQKLHDKAAAAAAAGPRMSLPGSLEPNMNWNTVPWSGDGLNPLIQKVLDAQKVSATKAAPVGKPSAVDAALKAAARRSSSAGGDKSASGSKGDVAPAASSNSSSTSGSESRNPLNHAVQLLAGMRWDGLEKLDAASGNAKKLAVYRALRTQQFLEFTASDVANREAKQRAIWQAIEESRKAKVVSKEELNKFYERLQADGEKRKAELAKAQSDKADKEAKILALASVGARSTRSTRSSRPHSAR